MSARIKNEVGKVYGKLTVIERVSSIGTKAAWFCQCSCGNARVVTGDNLRTGGVKSCGCNRAEYARLNSTTHGQSNAGGNRTQSRTYKSWQEMRSRCRNHRAASYRNYGAKGVTVCDRWDSFENFLEDMGERPAGMYIDRVDNNKGYSPTNCRWATRLEQNQNRSQCHIIEIDGVKAVLAEWCRKLDRDYNKAYEAIVMRKLNPVVYFKEHEP